MTGSFGTRENLDSLLDENKLPGPVHGSAEAGRGDRLAQCGFSLMPTVWVRRLYFECLPCTRPCARWRGHNAEQKADLCCLVGDADAKQSYNKCHVTHGTRHREGDAGDTL